MARPLRIEFAGALYHITSRGNARATTNNGVRSHTAHEARLIGALQS